MTKSIKCLLLTCLIAGLTFWVPGRALSQADQESNVKTAGNATYVSGITAGRARALVGGFAGLVCLVLGWQAKRRSRAGSPNVRSGAFAALIIGSIGIVLSVIHLIATAGAVFGSGSGKAGAIVAILLNSIGIVLAVLALRKNKKWIAQKQQEG